MENTNNSLNKNSQEFLINEAINKMLNVVTETSEEEVEEAYDIPTPLLSNDQTHFYLLQPLHI